MAKTYKPIFANKKLTNLPTVNIQYTKPTTNTNPTVPTYAPSSVGTPFIPLSRQEVIMPTNTTRTVQTPRGEKTVINNDRIKYADTTTEGIGQALRDNAGARFISGYYEGLSPVSMQDAIGQKYGQDTQEALQNSKAYAGGQMAGVATQFAIPYVGAAPKIGTALSGVSKFANMGKLGQGITKSVATDLAVGLPLNVNYALNKEGLRGEEALKSIGINTAIDLVAGGLIEVVPSAIKGMKKLVNKQTGETVAEVADEVADQVLKGVDNATQPSVRNLDDIKSEIDDLENQFDELERQYNEIADMQTTLIPTKNIKSISTKSKLAKEMNKIVDRLSQLYKEYADDTDAIPNQADTPTPLDVVPNTPNRPVEPRNVEKGTIGQEEQMLAEKGDFTIGADKTKPLSTTEELIAKNGALKPGMNPRARDTQVPKKSDIGKVQQATRTMVESKIVDDTLVNDILNGVREGSFTLFTKSNVNSVAGANNKIAEGIESAYDGFASVLKAGKQANSEDIALGARLLQEYQKAGDYTRTMDVAIDLSEMLSETGRTLQAAQIIKKLTPEGRLFQVQRTAKRMTEKFGNDVKISDETAKAISDAKTDAEIYKANEKVFTEMWNQIPASITNRVNAWRYMSMLINPKTHIRNIVGNAIFLPAREFKNAIGVGLEKAIVPVGQRTKAILTPKDKGLIAFANKDFANVVDVLRGETKYVEGARNQQADVFKNSVLEGLRKFGLNSLNAEDTWFLRAAYDSSFAQYMKSNKLTEADIVGDVLDKVRLYSMKEAEKATYRDASKLASIISKTKANLAEGEAKTTAGSLIKKVGEVALEGAIPFAKTPINILRRGFEYSPASLVTGLVDVTRGVKSGKVTAAEAIDTLSAGLSGTALVGLGAYLAHHGIVNGGSTDPYGTKEYNSQTMQGMQEYSLNVGDGTYTIDWAAPLSLPFFVGVEVINMLDKENGNAEDTFLKLVDSLTTVSDPLFNLSMLQGINNALNTWGGSDDVLGGAIGEIFKNTAMSYFGQFVPTFFGQIARTVDDTRRTTTSTDNDMLKRQFEKFFNQQKAKIPVANKKLEPYIDVWGRTEDSGTAFGNFLNPGYYKEINITKVDSEINDLYARLDEETKGDVLPRDTTRYTITEEGVDYRMSEKELTQFKTTRGQTAYTELNKLFASSRYKQMSDADKAKAIKDVYNNAFEFAKEKFLKKRASMPVKK